MKTRIVGTLILTLAAITLASCATKDVSELRSRTAARGEGPIKIGLAWPLELYGDLIDEGVQLGVEQINEAGGILGRQIELVIADDGADINEGLRVAESFTDDPEVMAVIGHCDSYVSLAVALTYETGDMVMFSPGSTNPGLTQKGYGYIFRNVPTDEMIGSQAAALCADKGYEDIIVCYADSDYGLSLANSFERRARQLGLSIIDRSSFSVGDKAEFEYIMDNWEIYDYDAVFFAGLIDSGKPFIATIRKRERDAVKNPGQEPLVHPIVGGDGIDSVDLLSLPQEETRDVMIIALYNPYSLSSEAAGFNQAYIARYGHDPDSWGALGYDALNIIAQAMRQAGSVDPKEVAPQIRNIKGWRGVTGLHDFNESGDVGHKTLVLKFIHDGEFKYLEFQ